jgi:hypothetical protein
MGARRDVCRVLVGNNDGRSSLKRPKNRWGMFVLKYIVMNWDGRRWTEFMWFRKEKSGWNLT